MLISLNTLALESHPQHAVYEKLMKGCGGMISFVIRADIEQTTQFVQSLKVKFRYFFIKKKNGFRFSLESLIKIVSLAVSLGSPETIINHPCVF